MYSLFFLVGYTRKLTCTNPVSWNVKNTCTLSEQLRKLPTPFYSIFHILAKADKMIRQLEIAVNVNIISLSIKYKNEVENQPKDKQLPSTYTSKSIAVLTNQQVSVATVKQQIFCVVYWVANSICTILKRGLRETCTQSALWPPNGHKTMFICEPAAKPISPLL